jgi:hypothetical protein
MFRFFAILLVIGAFVGALYFSGNALEAWESPKEAPAAMPKLPKLPKPKPKPKPKAKPKRHAQPVSNPVRRPKPVKKPAKPSWLVELNTVCRRGKAESASFERPSSPQEAVRAIKRAIGLNMRMNDETAALVERSGNAAATSRLRRLYDQDEALLQRALSATEQGRYKQLPGIARSLLTVAKAENDLFARLGAADCTVSSADLQL